MLTMLLRIIISIINIMIISNIIIIATDCNTAGLTDKL